MTVVDVHLVLYALAFICFCFGAGGYPAGRINLIGVGLALIALAGMITGRAPG